MNRLYEIELAWGMKPTPEQLPLISKLLGKPAKLEADGKLDWCERTITATLEEAAPLLPFTVKAALPYGRYGDDAQMPLIEPRTDVQPPMNQRCNVVVAGNGVLLDIREVCVKYDACTDSLQRDLDDGWRILAICVQPDQRRPDYVLGKIGGAR